MLSASEIVQPARLTAFSTGRYNGCRGVAAGFVLMRASQAGESTANYLNAQYTTRRL